MNHNELNRGLGLVDTTGLVIGTVIGTGIFLKTAVISQHIPNGTLVLVVWIVAGILSLAGALTYAELGVRFPKAGGEFIYLEKSYGPLLGFLYGWTRFWIGSPASIAAYGVGAATFLSGATVTSALPGGRTAISIFFITFITLINCLQVKVIGKLQTMLTLFKILIILILAIALIFFTKENHFLNSSSQNLNFSLNSFGTALIAALWAFDGWNNMPMVAGEVKNPKKIIPLALIIGMAIVLCLYLSLNFAYFKSIPLTLIQSGNSANHTNALPVATIAAQSLIGEKAIKLLSVAFVISAIGAMNGSVLTGARVPYAMAREGLFFHSLGKVNETTQIPLRAVVVQGMISLVLALSGTFDQLTDAVIFSSWIFYALCAGSVMIFRKKNSHHHHEYKTPLYPLTPIVFILVSVLLLANSIYTNLIPSLCGLLAIILGIPFYYYFKRNKK